MGGVDDGSMSSPPKIEYLPTTKNDDGIVSVDITSLPSSENPDRVSASVHFVATHYRSKNKELRVKVPCEYFSFIAPLWQMGFNRIERAESTCIVLREDAALAVPTPSEIACASDWKQVAAKSGDTRVGQGPEFKHSSRASSLGPASMGNDFEAVGFQGFFAGPEIPVQTKKRPRSANESKRLLKRTRGPDFVDEEKGLLLQFKLAYFQDPANKGKSHKWLMPVTDKMEKNGYDRNPASWQGLWDTLKKSRDAMRREFPQDTSYWNLTEVEKQDLKKVHCHFPLTFKPEWDVAIENICKMNPKNAAKEEIQRDGQEGVFPQLLASAITSSANFAGASASNANIQALVQQPKHTNVQGSDEDLLVNLQIPGPPPSCVQEFINFSDSLRGMDYRDMTSTMEEQVAVYREDAQLAVSAWKKLMESGSLDSFGSWDDFLV